MLGESHPRRFDETFIGDGFAAVCTFGEADVFVLVGLVNGSFVSAVGHETFFVGWRR